MKTLDIPEGWIKAKLPEIAAINMGQSPAGSEVNVSGDGLPFFQGKAEFGKLHPKVKKYCTAPKKIADANDILLSVRAPVGPTNLANRTTAIGRGLAAIKTDNRYVDFKFLLYYFRSIEPWMSEQGTGTTFKAISGQFLKELDGILPPLPEQKIIADKLDSLLAQVETIKARLDRVPEILKRFRQSVLAAAVSGRLTEDWREKNEIEKPDFSAFLDELNHCRKSWFDNENIRLGKKSKYKKALNEPVVGLPDLPASWQWISVDSLSYKVSDGVHKKPNYITSGVPFVTVKNLTAGPGISFDEINYVSEEDHIEFSKRTNPEQGDILISKDGTLGVVRKIRTDVEFSIFVSVALVKPIKKSMGDYLELAFQSPVVQAQMVGVGSGLQHIHLTDLRKDMIPVPTENEQAEIVRRVEQLFTYADKIEQQVQTATDRVNHLTQSILAKAFKGELTKDWRAANPDLISGENSAEALLEKIRAEREAMKPEKKRGVRRAKA
ncbi:MAG: restriction endonuclease subunit S [Thiolinea sp.]